MAKSVLLEKEEEQKNPKLKGPEAEYMGKIKQRLLDAKTERDKKHPEFNNRTFLEYYVDNEKLANTYVESKGSDLKDENGNVVISSGTVEQKLYTLVSEVVRLNLSTETRSFDKDSNELVKLGRALTDVTRKTEEWEGDEEHKINRFVELLKQGHVFVQEQWVREYKKKKKLKNKDSIGKLNAEWTEKLEKVFEGPQRKLLYAPGVYLGNIREYTMKRQPFIYTVNVTSYEEAKSRYGNTDSDGNFVWDRWNLVPKKKAEFLTEASMSGENLGINDGFSLLDSPDGKVEEIHYQDAYNNEFQIFLNGIPMLPVGFPLSAVSPRGEYNIEKQILQTINPFFAYGRSFVTKTKYFAALIDETIKTLHLKSRKSIHPPYANTSGRVISPKSLMPGRITMGLDPNSLVPIGQEGQGVTAAEYQMLRELRDGLDKITVSPQMQGQGGSAGTTAFEVSVLQQQAQKLILLTIASATFLEQKLGYLRLYNILENFFTPVDTQFDDAKKAIKNVFRKVSVEGQIEGRGSGIRQIIPVENDDVPDPESVMDMEDFEGTPEPREGERRKTREELGMKPVEKIFLNTDELRKVKLFFHVQVEQREKDTSVSAKRMFREELRDIAALMQLGSRPNVDNLEEQHARVWGRDKGKIFEEDVQQALGPQGEGGQQQDPSQMMERITQANSEGAPQEAPEGTPIGT